MAKRRPAAVAAALLCTLVAGSAPAGEKLSYTVDTKNFSIPQPLTDKPGDAAKGLKVVIDRRKGNCLACHTMPIPEQPFHGRIAPPLVGVGGRYDAGQLRLRVVDPKVLNPNSIMPAFLKREGFLRPLDKFAGKPILTAQEVEDIIAYLQTLR